MVPVQGWSLISGFNWLLYRGGLSSGVILAPTQGWSLPSGWSLVRGFTGSYTGVVSRQGGPSPGFLLAPIQGCLEVFTGSCTKGGLSLGWSPLSGVLLAPTQGWSLIRVVSQGVYWLLHRGGLSLGWSPPSGVLLAPAQGWSPPSGILLAHAQGWPYIGVVSHQGRPPSCTGVVFYWLQCKGGFSSGILLASVQGWFHTWVVFHGFFLLAPVLASSKTSSQPLVSSETPWC